MAYVDQRTDKRGAALTIGIHLAIGAAILLYPASQVIPERFNVLRTSNIPLPDDPPPPPPQQTQTKPLQQSVITQVPPIVDPPLRTLDPLPPVAPPADPGFSSVAGGITDLGGAIRPADPPVRAPVLVAALRDPRYASRFQPDYPSRLIREELTGSVKVRVLIGTDGRVKRVEQVSATHPDFFKATERQALSQWRFKPATRDSVPVESWETLTVRFTLDNM